MNSDICWLCFEVVWNGCFSICGLLVFGVCGCLLALGVWFVIVVNSVGLVASFTVGLVVCLIII